jgi:hypothetical protein
LKENPKKPLTVNNLKDLVSELFKLNKNVSQYIEQNNLLVRQNRLLKKHLYGANRAGPVVIKNSNVLNTEGRCPDPEMRKRFLHARRDGDVAVICFDRGGFPRRIAYHNSYNAILTRQDQMTPQYIKQLIGTKQYERLMEAHRKVYTTARPVSTSATYKYEGETICRKFRFVPCHSRCSSIILFVENCTAISPDRNCRAIG